MALSGVCLTGWAEAANLDGLTLDGEAELPGSPHDGFGNRFVIELGSAAAVLADKELADMRLLGAAASDIGVQRLDTMDEALLHQEVEGAVNRRRRRAALSVLEIAENVVGAYRRVTAPDEFEDLPTQIRQPRAAALAQDGGAVERVVNAGGVVMAVAMKGAVHAIFSQSSAPLEALAI